MRPVNTRVFAPAKVNLTLHVTGQRDDGYHLLDSLVVFTNVGDVLTVTLGRDDGLSVTGPFASDVPTGQENFIRKVAELYRFDASLSFQLEKNLPVASGIGGGSADAGACVRALYALAGDQPLPDFTALTAIGADLPMCVSSVPARVGGIGELIDPIPDLPVVSLVLINPGVPVETPAVFKALRSRTNPPMMRFPGPGADFVGWLADQRNDLQAAAITVAPTVRLVLEALASSKGCRLARMSGSGATCFGIFDNDAAAQLAAAELSSASPQWWVACARTDGHTRAAPQVIRSTT